ncbi:MAG: PepSY domain-containing protein, partial [Panacagrimonas sp.]
GSLTVNHVGDANSYVSIYRAGTDRVTLTGEGMHFQGSTGKLIFADPPVSAVGGINDFITGLHLQHFRHWLLRWFYFMGGMAGCACIATGLISFVEKRKRQHARVGHMGSRAVDMLAVTAVTGMVIATLAMLVFNRLLPTDLAGRDGWEETSFWTAWLLAFFHAALRTAPVRRARLAPAWHEQTMTIAILAISAVALNAITTGDHLVATLSRGYWPVAGVDLVLLAVSTLAFLAARRLRRAAQAPSGSAVDAFTTTMDDDAEPQRG